MAILVWNVVHSLFLFLADLLKRSPGEEVQIKVLFLNSRHHHNMMLTEDILSSVNRCSMRPHLLFLDAEFEALLHPTAPPLRIRLNLGTPTLLLLTQIPHLPASGGEQGCCTLKCYIASTTWHHFSLSLFKWPFIEENDSIFSGSVFTFLRCFLRSSLSSFDCFFRSFKQPFCCLSSSTDWTWMSEGTETESWVEQ